MSIAPTPAILAAFGADDRPQLLEGGAGTTYRAGGIVLKPISTYAEAEWLAELFTSIEESGFRVARPVRSAQQTWIVDGWAATQYIPGQEVTGRWHEKIAVATSFHQAIHGVAQPPHIALAQHPWAIADRFAWGEQHLHYHQRLVPVVDRLYRLLKPIDLPNQLIHGDMTGNILFHESLLPAVIDMAPYWRPAAFAIAIIIVDSIVWEGADQSLIAAYLHIEHMDQLLLRATIRRLVELDGINKQFGIDCFDQIDAYLPLIGMLST
ncbi:MAG: TIGR02569 family protein [Roseiflexaceae bacterium]